MALRFSSCSNACLAFYYQWCRRPLDQSAHARNWKRIALYKSRVLGIETTLHKSHAHWFIVMIVIHRRN